MVKLFLYNTLRRKKEEFRPIKKARAGLYTCGPTVYNFAHLGNLRSYVFADLLTRILRYNLGLTNVKWVMNITDVDDKTIRDSQKEGLLLDTFTKKYKDIFFKDIDTLNILWIQKIDVTNNYTINNIKRSNLGIDG